MKQTYFLRIYLFFLAFSGVLNGMGRIVDVQDQQAKSEAATTSKISSLALLALPKLFEWCNKNNIDVTTIPFPQDKLLELINKSPWAWSELFNASSPLFTKSATDPYNSSLRSVKAQFSADSTKVVMSDGESVQIVDCVNNRSAVRHVPGVQEVNFSPDGAKVIIVRAVGNSLVVETLAARALYDFNHDFSWSCSPLFSPDSSKILNIQTQEAQVLDARTGQPITTLRHDDEISSAAFSGDSKRVLTKSLDGIIKITDLQTGRLITILEQVYKARFSHDAAKVIATLNDGTVKIFTLNSDNDDVLHIRNDGPPQFVTISPDSTFIAVINSDLKMMSVFDAQNGSIVITITHQKPVELAVFSRDSCKIATVYDDGDIKIINIQNHAIIAVSSFGSVRSLVFSSDSAKLASVFNNGFATVVNANTGVLIGCIEHIASSWDSLFSPDSARLAAVKEDGTVGVIDIPTRQVIAFLRHSGTERIDPQTGNIITSIPTFGRIIFAAFSPDSRKIVIGSKDGKITIWGTRSDDDIIKRLLKKAVVKQ